MRPLSNSTLRFVSVLSVGLGLLFFVLSAGVAAAEPPPAPEKRRVALILQPASKRDAGKVAQLTKLLTTAFVKRGMERTRFLAPYDPHALAEARQLLREVRKDMVGDHNMRRAVEHEGKLIRVLLGLKSGLGAATTEELLEVYKGLAGTRLSDGDRRMAEDYMTAVINLKPSLHEKDFLGRGVVKDLLRDVRATEQMRKTTAVRVETKPSGAEVYNGDTFVGYSPITVSGIKTGTRLIRVKRDGFFTHGWLVDAPAGKPTKLTHSLRPVGGRSRFEKMTKTLLSKKTWKHDLPKDAAIAAQDLCRLFRADDIIVATVKRTKTGYTLLGATAARGREPIRLEVEIPVDAELLKRIDVLTYEWTP